jgi:hypothetical protein
VEMDSQESTTGLKKNGAERLHKRLGENASLRKGNHFQICIKLTEKRTHQVSLMLLLEILSSILVIHILNT